MQIWKRSTLRGFLKHWKVKISPCQLTKKLWERGVVVIDRVSGGKQFIEGDFVVLALGAEPDDSLAEKLKGKVPELHVVGDAKEPGGRRRQSTKAL